MSLRTHAQANKNMYNLMNFFLFSVIPQPVYMNSEELEKLRQQKAASAEKIDELPDDDLKTPTIEELTFPGHHRVVKIVQ